MNYVQSNCLSIEILSHRKVNLILKITCALLAIAALGIMFASIGFGWPLGVTLASLGAVVISSALFALLFFCKRPDPNDIAEKTRHELEKANYEGAVVSHNASRQKQVPLHQKMAANQRRIIGLLDELNATYSMSDPDTQQKRNALRKKRSELRQQIADLRKEYRVLSRELAEHERLS